MEGAPQWPWQRLLLLSLGSGLAMVGTYVIIYRMFEIGFAMSTDYVREPFVWGGLAVAGGLVLLGAPWFPGAPWHRTNATDDVPE